MFYDKINVNVNVNVKLHLLENVCYARQIFEFLYNIFFSDPYL